MLTDFVINTYINICFLKLKSCSMNFTVAEYIHIFTNNLVLITFQQDIVCFTHAKYFIVLVLEIERINEKNFI